MYYIYPATSKSTTSKFSPEIGLDEPLILAPRLITCRVGDEWLVVSPITGNWCYLNSKEWETALSLKGQGIHELAQSLKLPLSLIKRFVVSLASRGILVSSSSHSNVIRDVQKQHSRFILTLLLSNCCNLACEYCYHAFPKRNGEGNITRKIANIALRHAFHQSTDELMIDFGEIAVSEQIFHQLLDDAKRLQEQTSKQTIYAIQTNGTTVTRKKAVFFKENNIFVGLSLDGPALLHDMMRKSQMGNGSYKKARVGLGHLIDFDIPFIVNATIHRLNFQYIREILDHFNEINISHFVFKPILYRGSAVVSWNKIGLSTDEYHGFLDEMVALAFAHHSLDWLDTSFITLVQRALGDIRGWSSLCYSGYCQGSKTQLVVNSNGLCYPCPRYSSIGEGEFCLGSIESLAQKKEDSLEKTIISEKNEPFLLQKCESCAWSAFCSGGCPVVCDSSLSGQEMCSTNSKIYELIFKKIIPQLRSRIFTRSNKLGELHFFHEDFFQS
jgi:uncharacterized protein